MAHQWTRINLAATQFPFESDFWGRSILMPQYDTNFDFISQRDQPNVERGIPQAFYMHNCVPTAQGYQAVGYQQILSGIAGSKVFDTVFQLDYTTPQVAKFLFSPAGGKNYVYDANVGVWESMLVKGNAGTSPVAVAQVTTFNGVASTYVDESFTLANGTVLSSIGAFLNTANAPATVGGINVSTNTLGGDTYVSEEFQVPNNTTVTSINVYSLTAYSSGTVFILLQNTTTSFTVETSAAFSHLGNGWQTVTLATPFNVPITGTYYAAVYIPASTTTDLTSGSNSAYIAGVAAGTQTYTQQTNVAHPVLTVTYTMNSIELFIVQQNSVGNYTVITSTGLVAHNGAGWQDFTLAYTVPATGTFMVALYLPGSASWNANYNLSFASVAGIAVGTQNWVENVSSTTSISPPVRATTAVQLAIPATAFVTSAYVNGKSYIYYQNVGCMYYDQVQKCMQMVKLAGTNQTDIKGVCAANGYLIAWDDTTCIWSNISNPEDFVPSLVTGAGGGPIQFANGKIQFCLPISGGFLLYCDKNAVGANYSANVRYPYVFAEIAASGGCHSPQQVTWQGNLAVHYAWTTAGMQQLTKSVGEVIYPQATDFLAGLSFEDFDETTLQLSLTYLPSPVNVRLSVIAERYIVISYGTNYPEFTHALIYDFALKRWGKLKVKHRACFEWPAPAVYGPVTYGMLVNTTYGQLANTTYGQLASSGVDSEEVVKKNMAFLQADGTVQLADFDLVESYGDGVLILGKFQFMRNKWLIHQRTDVESVLNGNAFDAYAIASINGKDLLAPVPMHLLSEGQMIRKYGCRLSGQNISLLFIGGFNLTSVVIDVMMGGER